MYQSSSQEQLPDDLLKEMKSNFKKSFYWSCVAIFEHDFKESWLAEGVHKPLCDALQDPNNKRLAIVFPRDWLKSTVVSLYFVVWCAMLDPNFNVLIVMNTFTNAKKKMKAIRSLINGNIILRQLFPERMPQKGGQESDEAFQLPTSAPMANATFEIAGCGTQVISRHVSLILEDDTVAPEIDNMKSGVCEPTAEQVEKAIGFHQQAHFLLNDFKKDRRVVVGTRWCEMDLFTHIEANEPDYKFISRAVRENEAGEPDMDGELTYPLRFDDDVLKEIKSAVGPYMYSALMMNMPINASTRVFQQDWICNYEHEPTQLLCYTTVDPASTDEVVRSGADPDYNIVLTTGIDTRNGNIYVLDYFRERCNPGALIGAIIDHVRRFTPLKVGIETVAYQKSLMYWIKEMQNAEKIWFTVEKLVGQHKAKEARIHGLVPLFHSHRIYSKSWMVELSHELLTFPRGAHDDIIDALAYQLEFWAQTDLERKPEVVVVDDRFTGDWLLKKVEEKYSKPKGFPHDCAGHTMVVGNRMMTKYGLKKRGFY